MGELKLLVIITCIITLSSEKQIPNNEDIPPVDGLKMSMLQRKGYYNLLQVTLFKYPVSDHFEYINVKLIIKCYNNKWD